MPLSSGRTLSRTCWNAADVSAPAWVEHSDAVPERQAGLDAQQPVTGAPGEPSGGFHDGGALLGVPVDLRGVVEVANHPVAVLPQRRPAQVGTAEAGRTVGGGPRVRATQQRLGRDAAQ